MRRWFSGRLQGHYVGMPAHGGGALSPSGETFRLEIYRAVIHDLQLTADEQEPVPAPEWTAPASPADGPETGAPQASPLSPEDAMPPAGALADGPAVEAFEPVSHHHTPTGSTLHQRHIARVHFVDAHGPGRTLAGAAYDVLASELTFSHPARHAGRAYGRIEAHVTGYYRPPPEPPPPREEHPPDPAVLPVWSAREARAARAPADAAAHVPIAEPAASPAEVAPGYASDANPVTGGVPLFALAAALTVALLLLATPAAAIWCLCFLPTYAMRRWLVGVVPDGGFIRLVGLLMGFFELAVAASVVTGFLGAGCRTLSVLPLLTLVGAPVITSVMPRPYPYLACLLALCAVLFAYYGPLGLPLCGPNGP